MQNNIDIIRRPFRRNMLQSKFQSGTLEIDNQRPFKITITISPNDCDRRANCAQLVQNYFRANIPQMPNLIRFARKIDNSLRQFVMRVCENKYSCHVEGRWIGRSAGDVKLMRLCRHFLASSKGLLDPPHCAQFELK